MKSAKLIIRSRNCNNLEDKFHCGMTINTYSKVLISLIVVLVNMSKKSKEFENFSL